MIKNELPLIGVNVAYHLITNWNTIMTLTYGSPTRTPTGGMFNETMLSGWDLFFVGMGWGSDYAVVDLYDSDSYRPNGLNIYNFPGDTATFAGSSWDDLRANLFSSTTDAEVYSVIASMEAYHYEWEIAAPIVYIHEILAFQLEVIGIDPYLLSRNTQHWELIDIDDSVLPELNSLNPILVLSSIILAPIILRRKIK